MREFARELMYRPMKSERLDEVIGNNNLLGRPFTDKERQLLHISNGTQHKHTGDTTCYYCDDKISEHMMCEDCRAERLGSCADCGKRIVSRVYVTSGTSVDTNMSLNLCRVCINNHSNCAHVENGRRQCGRDVKTGTDYLCAVCTNLYCKEHVEHPHIQYNGYQREYEHEVYFGEPSCALRIKDTRLVGVELEAVGGHYAIANDKLLRQIGISHDGSLEGDNPIEIQTPPASNACLEELIYNACGALNEAGFKTNDSCGMHIHIDCSDVASKPAKIRQIINTYYAIEPIIYAMLPTSRRDNAYAQPLSNWISGVGIRTLSEVGRITMHKLEEEWYKTESVRRIAQCKDRKYDSSRYHGLNLHPLFQGGHIEMRYHHGTLSPMAITNWIKFHLHVMNWAIKKYNETDIESVYNERHYTQKINKMLKCLRLPTDLRRYVRRSIRRSARINNAKIQ
jgi:hypothetical protein